MKVCLYSGSLHMVERSGVGQAVQHQKQMLRSAGVDVTMNEQDDFDVIHLNTIFPVSPLTALKARRAGKKVVYYGHSTMEDFRNSFKLSNQLAGIFKWWICQCYKTGDVIITPTEYSRKLLRSYGLTQPIYVLSNGVDTEFFSYTKERRHAFRDHYGIGHDEKVVVSVGHYIVRKGILDFIELARHLPDVRFFWFGYTDPRLLPSEVTNAIRTAPENVVFPGYVAQEELRDAYCGADLFAFMSYEETEGIVVLEAMSCGTPTLVRDIPVYEEWLQDGIDVLKATDMEGFIQKTRDVLEGRTDIQFERQRALAMSRSYASLSRRLMEIYKHEFGLRPDSLRLPLHDKHLKRGKMGIPLLENYLRVLTKN